MRFTEGAEMENRLEMAEAPVTDLEREVEARINAFLSRCAARGFGIGEITMRKKRLRQIFPATGLGELEILGIHRECIQVWDINGKIEVDFFTPEAWKILRKLREKAKGA